MAITVLMPRMGYDMQEARVVQWLKAEGDHVNMGEDIAEIETDKAIVPMPSVGTGTLLRQMAAEGDVVPVGQILAVIGQPGEEIPPEMLVIAAPAASAAPEPPPPSTAPLNATWRHPQRPRLRHPVCERRRWRENSPPSMASIWRT